MTDKALNDRFHLRWVAEKGRPPLSGEEGEFSAAKKWFIYGLTDSCEQPRNK